MKTETSAAKNIIPYLDEDCLENDCFDYILEVSDNGAGIPIDRILSVYEGRVEIFGLLISIRAKSS